VSRPSARAAHSRSLEARHHAERCALAGPAVPPGALQRALAEGRLDLPAHGVELDTDRLQRAGVEHRVRRGAAGDDPEDVTADGFELEAEVS
jgi:hypothetical protein